MLLLFFSVFGECEAPPRGWNMNYSIFSRFQWIRMDANILEMMQRKTEEKNIVFVCVDGPSVSPTTLEHCADQLSPVFTVIFNTSPETCHMPACFKISTIIPVPKKPWTTGLNDYRLIALTSVVMSTLCSPTSNP